ncbi:MAG: acetylxylan esterase [Phycisphaerae bacterium]|jgi:cephalosporin-C deacetylase
MPLFDLPLSQLESYKLPDYEPADFDDFWKVTMAEAARFPLEGQYEKVDSDIYRLLDVYDVTYRGFGGHPIKAWFIEPAGNTDKLPCVVTYIGYTGGRGIPAEHLLWPCQGYASLVMDTRGQGASIWTGPGGTPDPVGSGPFQPGYMTRGIDSRESYFYRRVFIDALRAVELAATHKHVDPSRLAVSGGSQGGGISIAAAALAGKKVKLAMPDVPFLCGYRRACDIIDTWPYNEIAQYLKAHRNKVEDVFKVLAYFDGVNFAPRITARCMFSVGMMDTTCPPSTIFAAYNRIAGEKEMRTYDFNGHEGGGAFQTAAKMRFAAKYL